MKKPLLYSLFIWLLLFLLPATRPQAWLDWKSATLEQFSDSNPAWAPLDPPYQPEKNTMAFALSPGTTPTPKENIPEDVKADEFLVAPQFASLARSSSDRDVLVWCARSASTPKAVTGNLVALCRRFPEDTELLAWACGAEMSGLNMTTRQPGPLSSPFPNWSVQKASIPGYAQYSVELGQKAKWEAIAAHARQGQKREPSNGFWWWLEAASLLGARRDGDVWAVLRVGKTKTAYDDHMDALLFALRRAHFKTQGAIPITFYLNDAPDGFPLYARWRETARQVCENVIGERLQGHHKTAVEGGRDMMFMGKMLGRSKERLALLVGLAIEAIVFKRATAVPPTFKPSPLTSSPQVLVGAPGSLSRYAADIHRPDIARQVTMEWNVAQTVRRQQTAKTRALVTKSSGWITGVDDSVLGLAGGFQNTATLLVQTLPVPLIALALLSLGRRRDEPFPLPAWTRGLGWSAFSLLALIVGQALMNHALWGYVGGSSEFMVSLGFDFLLPRMVLALPLWAFTFSICVLAIGALWATLFAARRAQGALPLFQRLKMVFTAPDDRVGVVNLEPLMQIVGIAGAWGLVSAALALWFFQPQRDFFQNPILPSTHELYPGLFLALFCLLTLSPTLFFRARPTPIRSYWLAWVRILRRFLAAHIALATTLYLLLTIGSLFWGARFDAQWQKANTPPALSGT